MPFPISLFSQTRRLVPALPRRCSRTQVRAYSRPRRRIPARGVRPRIVYLDRLDVVISTAVEDEAACARRSPWTPRIPRARRGSGTCIACTTSFHVPWRVRSSDRTSARAPSHACCPVDASPAGTAYTPRRQGGRRHDTFTFAVLGRWRIYAAKKSQMRTEVRLGVYLRVFRGFPHALWE
jgi:hypothetical protein